MLPDGELRPPQSRFCPVTEVHVVRVEVVLRRGNDFADRSTRADTPPGAPLHTNCSVSRGSVYAAIWFSGESAVPVALAVARRRLMICVCIWLTRDSLRSRVAPISFIVMSS